MYIQQNHVLNIQICAYVYTHICIHIYAYSLTHKPSEARTKYSSSISICFSNISGSQVMYGCRVTSPIALFNVCVNVYMYMYIYIDRYVYFKRITLTNIINTYQRENSIICIWIYLYAYHKWCMAVGSHLLLLYLTYTYIHIS
jgi:hypothetical protein